MITVEAFHLFVLNFIYFKIISLIIYIKIYNILES